MAAPTGLPPSSNKEELPAFLNGILYPTAMPSLRESMPTGLIQVMLHTSADAEPRELILSNMFPFHTLQDIKLALYVALGKDDAAIPEFVYLATHGLRAGKTYLGGGNAPVDFSWNDPSLSADKLFLNHPPFKLVSGALPLDKRFVDPNGARRIIEPVRRERVTLEDAYLKRTGPIPTLHAYLYRDLLAAVEGPRPVGEATWNGRLGPYFPFLSATSEPNIAEFRARAQRLATIFTRRQQFLTRMEELLDENIPLLPLTLTSVRLLRLTWSDKKRIPGIEAQFYEATVTPRRPFMRLIPTEGTGISKVYLIDGRKPDIQDPQLLVSWAQEHTPTAEQDFAFAKVLLRKGFTNVPPLYATLRLFNDGTADAILEPPRGIRKLDPRADLHNYGQLLLEGLEGLPYLSSLPEIGHAGLVLGVKLQKDASKGLTTRSLRDRLPIFSSCFQEIAPLPGERPLIMLRYKLLSNFVTEDRIQAFITQVKNRKLVQGEGITRELVELVADEFQMDMEAARRRVGDKLRNDSEVALVVPETKDYMLEYNPGIDIAIYAQHPFYTFHLYRVNSLENLRRVITLLSLMISAEPGDLTVSTRAAKELHAAETAEARAGNMAPGADVAAVGAADAADAAENNLGDFVNLGENEAAGAAAAPFAEPGSAVADFEDTGMEDIPDYWLMGADDEGDVDRELEEGRAEEEAGAAAAVEGTPYPERGQGQAAAVLPPAPPVQAIRNELAAGVGRPEEELAGVPVAAAAPATAAVAAAAAANEEEATAGEADAGLAQYFRRKLQEADARLFRYDKTHPSLKRYVSMCQPTYGRQPAVLSEAKFQAMREEYADDGIVFHVYPLQPGEPEVPKGVVEKDYFTVLRYGTTPQNQNYYVCSRYFCTRDEIVILEKDLDSNEMRRPKGASKKRGECPFCRGTVVQSTGKKGKQYLGPNETIIERGTARASDKRHLYIRMLGKTPHPEGFYLPCCFIDEVPVKYSAPAFDKYREWGMPAAPKEKRATVPVAEALAEEGGEDADEEEGAAPVAEEEGEEVLQGTVGPREEAGYPILDYFVTLAGVTRKYIVGAEKLPLEVGTVRREAGKDARGEPQIGLLPKELDEYFDQDQTQLVSRSFNPQKIKPDGQGFLRIGVENRLRYQNDSLLAAIAPFYMKNTAQQMKELLDEKITVRVFLGLNYGNLAIEFFDPTGDRAEFYYRTGDNAGMRVSPLPRPALADWASAELDLDVSEENEQALQRAYMSYESFRNWLAATDTKKEFRHFALLFAQSGLMRRPGRSGITFIVLDIGRDGKVTTRCPPFGMNADLTGTNDIAFLLHHWSGIWEPIFYVDNRAPEQRGIDIFTLLFQYSVQGQWPPVVRKRVQEYMAQCNSSARGVYTDQSAMHPLAMIPASLAKRLMMKDGRVVLEGVVRDTYNHIAALLFREKAAAGGGRVALPVIDDGELFLSTPLILDWDDPAYTRAPIDTVLKFYETYVSDRFRVYPGMSPVRVVKSRGTGAIEAVQLRNGLFVPCAPPSSEEAARLSAQLPMIEVDEMEWAINRTISLQEDMGELPGEKERMDILEFQEIFEHLRLIFSNWLATNPNGGDFRKQLEDVIFSRRLPLYEKRKRMEILLATTVESWIATDNSPEDAARKKRASILRADCTLKDTAGCGGRCVWRRRLVDGEEKGVCLLHAPAETQLGEDTKKVSAPRVLLLRLIEELLRYGERRRQLLTQDVSQMAALEKPITLPAADGGKGRQRIYPEKSAAWFELLRLDWAKRADEKPLFVEEMSRGAEPGIPAAAAGPAEEEEGSALPIPLQTLLAGGVEAAATDPKVGALRLLRAPFSALLAPLGISPKQLSLEADTMALEEAQLRELNRMTGRVVVQINLTVDPPAVSAKKPFRIAYPTIPVFIVTTEGPALLVRNPAQPEFLAKEDLPSGLATIVEKAKGVLGIRPPAAAAAAPKPVAAAPPPPPAPAESSNEEIEETNAFAL